MQLASVPRKLVDISVLPVKDPKTRRLFILADGKRSLAQIFNICKVGIQEGFHLVESMLDDGHLEFTEGPSSTVRQQASGDTRSVPVDQFITGLTAELAKFIGPVASIVMADFDLPEKEISFERRQQVIDAVTEEIDSADRERFLLEVRAATWF